METSSVLLVGLVTLLIGLAVGKAWERYKLQDGVWTDRRRARECIEHVLKAQGAWAAAVSEFFPS